MMGKNKMEFEEMKKDLIEKIEREIQKWRNKMINPFKHFKKVDYAILVVWIIHAILQSIAKIFLPKGDFFFPMLILNFVVIINIFLNVVSERLSGSLGYSKGQLDCIRKVIKMTERKKPKKTRSKIETKQK